MSNPIYLKKKFSAVANFIGMDIHEYARNNYQEDYSNILNDKMKPEINQILESCNHNKDKRTNLDYAKDIMLGWIVEDYIFDILTQNTQGLSIKKTGIDSSRKFSPGYSVKNTSDFMITSTNGKCFVELISDYNGFWRKTNVCHLRDNKLKYLIETSSTINTFILALDVINNQFQLIKIDHSLHSKFIKEHRPFGNKSAYEIAIQSDNFNNMNDFPIKILEGL